MSGLKSVGLLLVVAAALAAPAAALADPPANDVFAGAVELTGRTATTHGITKDATKEPGEPAHAGDPGGASVWFRWTAPASGRAVVNTCDSGFDTLLAVYTGDAIGALTAVASNDDACGLRSSTSFTATEGVTYRIAIDGAGGVTGEFGLTLRLTPPNDDFADAVALAGDAGTVAGTNVGASFEEGEPRYGSTVWYRWTAPSSGWATFETCGSSFDTVLAVFTGTDVAALELVDWSDDACDLSSRVVFEAAAGVAYSVMVDGYDGEQGEFVLSWNRNSPPPQPPFALDNPSITGSPQEGGTLTASEGEWAGTPTITYAFAWGRCSISTGRCDLIPGAAGRSYTLTSADVEARVYVQVTATNAVGSGTATSQLTPLVRPNGPINTGAPGIAGDAIAGEVLLALNGTWRSADPIQFAYQWQACDASASNCVDLANQRQGVITLGPEHVGKRLRVAVTATNVDGARTLVSDPTALVVQPKATRRRACIVPNVRGRSLRQARAAIVRAHCTVGRVRRAYSRSVRVGRVVSQTPRAGARLAAGARVRLVVSKGRRR